LNSNTGRVLSVNVGQARPIAAKSGLSGIDKRPVQGAVSVRAPGPKGAAGSGLAGDAIVLEVASPRLPCRTFAVWLEEQGWVKTFTERALPGAYLCVVAPGMVAAGDRIEVVDRPAHDITIGSMFRALTSPMNSHRTPTEG
jgi:MOSC domain-containing protein YiiM